MSYDNAKTLNMTGTKNRFRFQKMKERISRVDVDVAHKLTRDSDITMLPSGGEGSSFFRDEVDRLREIHTIPWFVRFHEKMSIVTENLAQLIHHLPGIVGEITRLFEASMTDDYIDPYPLFSLVAVLSCDVRR